MKAPTEDTTIRKIEQWFEEAGYRDMYAADCAYLVTLLADYLIERTREHGQ